MRVTYNVKYCYAICLKFREKLMLHEKARNCSTIKENVLLSCCKFFIFVFVVISEHIFITGPVSQKNTACNRSHKLHNAVVAFQNRHLMVFISDIKLPYEDVKVSF